MSLSFAPNTPALSCALVDNLSWFLYADGSWTSIFLAITPRQYLPCFIQLQLILSYNATETERLPPALLFPFFLLSRLDFVQLHWKRSQFWKQVQILAQFLFIYSPSYFGNCCQVKTLFHRRQVNMPIPFLCLSCPLCWGGGMRPCWVWPWVPEGWGSTQSGIAPHSDLGTQLTVTSAIW